MTTFNFKVGDKIRFREWDKDQSMKNHYYEVLAIGKILYFIRTETGSEYSWPLIEINKNKDQWYVMNNSEEEINILEEWINKQLTSSAIEFHTRIIAIRLIGFGFDVSKINKNENPSL